MGGTDYQVHTFTSSGTVPLNDACDVECLIVAGGADRGNGDGATGGNGGSVIVIIRHRVQPPAPL